MSIASEITALNANLTAAKDAVVTKGGTVGDTGLAGLAAEIASIPSGSSANTITIEIGENSVTQATQLYNYFLPYFQGAIALLGIEIVENTYTENNQFVRFRCDESTSYNAASYRWRNGSVSGFSWNAASYDVKIVVGTHYTITWIS